MSQRRYQPQEPQRPESHQSPRHVWVTLSEAPSNIGLVCLSWAMGLFQHSSSQLHVVDPLP